MISRQSKGEGKYSPAGEKSRSLTDFMGSVDLLAITVVTNLRPPRYIG